MRIRNREFITDITTAKSATGTGASSAFKSYNFHINPGLSDTFPWLSTIADSFETYKLHGLVFQYRSTSGEISTTTALGTLIQVAQYNAGNDPFQNKFQMENYQNAISTVPSRSQQFGIECSSRDIPMNHLYVRTGGVPAGEDPRLYDPAIYQIATTGCPVFQVPVGELWVTYDIEFFQPKLPQTTLSTMLFYLPYLARPNPSTNIFNGMGLTGLVPGVQPSPAQIQAWQTQPMIAQANNSIPFMPILCPGDPSNQTSLFYAGTIYFIDSVWAGKQINIWFNLSQSNTDTAALGAPGLQNVQLYSTNGSTGGTIRNGADYVALYQFYINPLGVVDPATGVTMSHSTFTSGSVWIQFIWATNPAQSFAAESIMISAGPLDPVMVLAPGP